MKTSGTFKKFNGNLFGIYRFLWNSVVIGLYFVGIIFAGLWISLWFD